MANADSAVDELGPWSVEKLDILSEYLAAYTRIMNAQGWCRGFYYVDAFTGTLTPWDRDNEEYLLGSPLRALETTPSFSGYFFIDIKQGRANRAEKLKSLYPQQKIEVCCGDCNDVLRDMILPKVNRQSARRALVFLDPYGLQVRWETVEALAKVKTCDMFINFPIMGIIRNLPTDREPDPAAVMAINQVFGDEAWRDGLYTKKRAVQGSLFGGAAEPEICRARDLSERLTRYYLRKIAALGLKTSSARIMRNSKNTPLYALLLATPKEAGVKIMNDIFKKYEELALGGGNRKVR